MSKHNGEFHLKNPELYLKLFESKDFESVVIVFEDTKILEFN